MHSESDGIIQISQQKLIALQGDAKLLRQSVSSVRSVWSGSYASRFKGRGMEFDEARPYQPGDDVRNIDWRVTARTNKPHSKVFREERERPVLLWVDFRPAMFFGTQQSYKSVMAAKLAALLAWKSTQQGDRLGGFLFSSDRHLEIRPGRGKTAVLHMIRQLSEFSQSTDNQPSATAVNGDADHALSRLIKSTRPGSLIYLISDFRHLSNQLESSIVRLSRHNELQLIQVYDPLEQQLPQQGYYRITDGIIETQINASDSGARQSYQSRFDQHQQYLKDLCKKNRARFVPISTAQSLLDALVTRPSKQVA